MLTIIEGLLHARSFTRSFIDVILFTLIALLWVKYSSQIFLLRNKHHGNNGNHLVKRKKGNLTSIKILTKLLDVWKCS